ncbi:MAG: AAA family ATPase, partial [Propionibacterium sp.]|nr:AAA family ATPase [Propionibacterium sp.]
LESLEAATRSYLGWKRVQATSDSLNLSAQQRKQTDDWVGRLDQTVSDRIRDTFVWAVYPEQFDPTKPFELIADRVPDSRGRSLAERVGTKLGREDQLVTDFGAPILGATLHNELGALWRDAGEISVGELWGYFTRYTYLPRLVRREVLDGAIQQALTTVLVDSERFGIAAGKDTDTGRYRRLVVPPDPNASIQVTNSTLLVDADKAQEQVDADRAAAREAAARQTEDGAEGVGPVDFAWTGTSRPTADSDALSPAESALEAALARFFGSVKIDPDRYSRDIGNVTREVIDRLSGAGARLEITIDIQATKPEGFDEAEVRTISENARVLKFDPSSGFEKS